MWLKRYAAPWLKNFGGWKTGRKIVVVESDDWGSIRMPSAEAYRKCLAAGYPVDGNAYERYDGLASETDLELLYELLASHKDRCGNSPVITANVLTSNPDFNKIRTSGFSRYFHEPVTETFNRFPEHRRSFELWLQGLEHNIFFPQSHGREHLNVSLFMEALQRGDQDLHFAFDLKMPGIVRKSRSSGTSNGNPYVETTNYFGLSDKEQKLRIVLEGLDLFEQLFGYRSESFIPPNYLWSPDFDEAVSEAGVKFYQGNRRMVDPGFDGIRTIHARKLGQENRYGQCYIVRNVLFEPSLFRLKIKDPVANCLNGITAAFAHGKPAVICSHRINYVGYIDPANRDRSLEMLERLLDKILTKWPDTEFMNSVQLGRIMNGEGKEVNG